MIRGKRSKSEPAVDSTTELRTRLSKTITAIRSYAGTNPSDVHEDIKNILTKDTIEKLVSNLQLHISRAAATFLLAPTVQDAFFLDSILGQGSQVRTDFTIERGVYMVIAWKIEEAQISTPLLLYIGSARGVYGMMKQAKDHLSTTYRERVLTKYPKHNLYKFLSEDDVHVEVRALATWPTDALGIKSVDGPEILLCETCCIGLLNTAMANPLQPYFEALGLSPAPTEV